MSLKDLMNLAGVPGLDAGVTILISTYRNIENIKVYRQQCQDLSARCVKLLLALRESSKGLEGTKAIEKADELEAVIRRIDRKVYDWANLNRLRSFLQQSEIKDGIDSLHRDLDSAMMGFQINIGMGLARNNIESNSIRERDKTEIRELLQMIVQSHEDMKALLNMHSSQPVEAIMGSLQTELMDPDILPNEEETFRDSLWMLHKKTSKLPPLTDLTGQITLSTDHVVVKGAFNDIYAGEWLNKEKVALRISRPIANDPDAQRRFQREVSIWRNLDHPNVVPLYGIVYIEQELYSVSPWMDNGTASSYVQHYPGANRQKILSEIASGLDYLHEYGIVHGDLRGANVLISKDGVACLSDFGLSKFLEDCGQAMTTPSSLNPRWFAPELLVKNGRLSRQSDVWSFGMVCLEILSGEQPFSAITRDIAVLRELDRGKIPDRPGRVVTAQGLTDEMWSLMKKCWNKSPEARPSMAFIKSKLYEIRGIATESVSSPPQKRRSMFSLRRPRQHTTDSEKSKKSLRPLSILSRSSNEDSLRNFDDTTHAFGGSSYSEEASSLSVIVEGDNSLTSLPRVDPRPPRLDLEHLSASTPIRTDGNITPRANSSDYPSPMRSTTSGDSGVFMSPPLKEALTTTKRIVYLTKSGVVASGTLEGLIDRLINNFNLRKDLEYRDILLTACVDFTTPEDVFDLLARRFQEAEMDATQHLEDRIALQYNIFMVLMYWLSSRHLPVDQQLLWRMRTFCDSAYHKKTSVLMQDKIGDLLKMIDERPIKDMLNGPLPMSPGRRIPQASDILPQDLAIALTLLEGDRYKNILPSDYVAHLRRHPGPNRVESAYVTNNKIVLWVKQSILYYDTVEYRGEVLKFFINTAQECRKLRNFASLTAIGIALHSSPIDRLKHTKAYLSEQMRRKLEELEDIYDPSQNHKAYRKALSSTSDPANRNTCIPWLPIHLRELHQVLQQNPLVVEVDGQPLINFQRYVKFTDRVRESLHFRLPDLEKYRYQDQLAYLESQLRTVQLSANVDEELMARSVTLEARETQEYKGRRRELQSLGFDIPNYYKIH